MKNSFFIAAVLATLTLCWRSTTVSGEYINVTADPSNVAYISGQWMDANKVVFAGNELSGGGVTYSTDKGVTWTASTIAGDTFGGLFDLVHYDVTVPSSTGSYTLAVDDGGKIFGSTDLAVTFSRFSTVAFGLFAVTIGSDGSTQTTAYAAGVRFNVYKSSPPFTSWTGVSPTPVIKRTFNGISTFDGVKVIACGSDGVVYYSVDSGANWVLSTNTQTTAILYDVKHVDASTAFMVGSGSYVAKTTDSGATWTVLSVFGTGDVQIRFHPLSIVNANLIYVGGGNGEVYFTTDGGSTWILDDTLGTPVYSLAMSADAAEGVIGSEENTGIWRLVPGESWYSIVQY